MYIGIDVGGTFTDGVLLDENNDVLQSIKVPTYQDLSKSIEEALEHLIRGTDTAKIKRLVLSTTLITNILAQKHYEPVGLLLIPGPGLNPDKLNFIGDVVIIDGAVDYRGRVIEKLNLSDVDKAATYFSKKGIHHLAVACKFSQRNPELEDKVIAYLDKHYPHFNTMASHNVSGLLNWVRRSNGTAFTLAVNEAYQGFIQQVKETLHKRGIACPLHILKADGGTLPLEASLRYPLEGVFSGPAASTMGALALTEESTTAIVMDMGGTTTDLALILKGAPLLADKGASLEGYPIPTRALSVASLALGGDTSIKSSDNKIGFGKRQGPALCLGGPVITITDILVYAGLCHIGEKDRIKPELDKLAQSLQLSAEELCKQVTDLVIDKLEKSINAMFKTWEEEPAYRIWQVLSKKESRPGQVICLGGPAEALGLTWGRNKNWKILVPPHAQVANAVGAALAKNTIRMDLIVDTEQKTYSTSIGGVGDKLNKPLNTVEQAHNFALELFEKTKDKWDIQRDNASETEILYEEGFNIVRGWHTAGKIFQIGVQTTPGLIGYVDKGVKTNE